MRQLNYWWRIVATGFCFFCFSVGGLLLSLLIFPLIAVLPLDEPKRKCLAQRMVHYSFRFFVGLMQFVGVLRVTVKGAEKLQHASQLIVANHPTLIDVVILISLLQETDCIVKQALWQNLFLRGVVLATGYISNSQPQELIADCVACLQKGRRLIVFPEGTRSHPGQQSAFQRGAANVALRAGVPITPVRIDCRPPSLTKGEKWYNVPREGRVHITVEIGDSIEIQPFLQNMPLTVASRRLTGYLENYYQREATAHE